MSEFLEETLMEGDDDMQKSLETGSSSRINKDQSR